ncbi:MAG TPA: HupE/UreJ family protein [Phenylobacterium sp.]|nr:HupE/UreJ family protein [Phenylobacterium sp.]
MTLRLAAFAFALFAPTLALAHPGDHSAMGFAQGLHHLVSEPDHLAMAALAVVAVGGWGLLRARRAR